MAQERRRRGRPVRQRARSRLDDLLDEAARQFNARGVSQTSLATIADQLGISRAALYYYIEDREDLVFKVYRRSLELLARHLGEAARTGRKSFDVLNRLVASSFDASESEIASLSELGILRGPELETILALYEGVVARLAVVLEAGGKAGEIRICDFGIAARCVLSIIFWIPLAGRWNPNSNVDRDTLLATAFELIRYGIAADRSAGAAKKDIDVGPLLPAPFTPFDRQAEREKKRETILIAASRLFNSNGIDTTSLDKVAESLGTNKKALYRYVGDKETLVVACYERAFRIASFISDQADALGLRSGEALDAQQRAHALIQQNRDVCPLRQLSGLDSLSPSGLEAVLSMSVLFTMKTRVRALKAQTEGEMRSINMDAYLLLGSGSSAWLAKAVRDRGEAERHHTANEVADFARIGLAPLQSPKMV